jgi:nucleoside-diphosphate-sugar epimerase
LLYKIKLMETVLVTGGTGFLGAHCIIQLLQAGYQVKTTLRSLSKKDALFSMLRNGGLTSFDHLTFAEADLTKNAGWDAAAQGCTYVLHVASPFPATIPKDENELIEPAVDGTLRVLRAARKANVKRVVLTSSFAAVGYGYAEKSRVFTEKDWTKLDGVDPYQKSKTMAERAAWDFAKQEGLDLAVINPVGIFGPVLGKDLGTSAISIQKLMEGYPGVPKVSFGVVDVRDVAALHLLAMTNPAAKGERFLAVAGEPVSLREMGVVLKAHLGDDARKVPTKELPNWVVRIAAMFDPTIRSVLGNLGKRPRPSNEKAKRVLGWKPRTSEEALVSMAKSLLQFGVIKQ